MARVEHESLESILGISHELATERIGFLTLRESEVATLLAGGEKSPVIARKLKISPKTLDIHRAMVKRKLEARTVVDIARIVYAAKLGEL